MFVQILSGERLPGEFDFTPPYDKIYWSMSTEGSKAKERGWKIFTLEGGHYPMRDQPEALVKKLEMILK